VLGCSFVLLLTGYAGAQTMTLSTLYVFRGPPDGALPSSGLVRGQDGVLYGTTVAGGIINDDEILGKNGCGTVYSLSPPTSPDQRWTETVLYAFAGLADGCGPANGVVVGRGGVLYGTTSNSTSGGTAFSLWPRPNSKEHGPRGSSTRPLVAPMTQPPPPALPSAAMACSMATAFTVGRTPVFPRKGAA